MYPVLRYVVLNVLWSCFCCKDSKFTCEGGELVQGSMAVYSSPRINVLYRGETGSALQAGSRLENRCLCVFPATNKFKGLNICNMVEEEYSLGRSVHIGT